MMTAMYEETSIALSEYRRVPMSHEHSWRVNNQTAVTSLGFGSTAATTLTAPNHRTELSLSTPSHIKDVVVFESAHSLLRLLEP